MPPDGTTSPAAKFPAKLKPLLTEEARFRNIPGGRGSGKSWGIARALLLRGSCRPERILCTREVQRSIKDSVHRLLSDQIEVLGLQGHYEVLHTEIRGRPGTPAAGTLFVFSGLSDQTVDSLKSYEGVTRCWVEEAQVVSERSWKMLTPTIRAPGSEIWLSWNPDLDTDPTWLRFMVNPPPDCQTIVMNWRDNPWFPEVLERERQHCKRTDPVSYDNIWEGKPRAAVEGAIYEREMVALAASGRVRNVPADPLLKTHSIWDLGFNDATAIILVQRCGSELRIIDYLEDTHRTMVEWANELKGRGLNLGHAWLPWDGSAERYRQTDPNSSPEGILRRLGLNPRIVPKITVEDGITMARLTFPMCYFDADRTVRLREALKRYRRVIPTTTDEPTTPLHDQWSHGADAFRYLAVAAKKLSNDDQSAPMQVDLSGIV